MPAEISDFERRYLTRLNRIALVVVILLVPVIVGVAALHHTGPLRALSLSVAILVACGVGYLALGNPRTVSIVLCAAGMWLTLLPVLFAQLTMPFFGIAMLTMVVSFSNPRAVLVCALAVALQPLAVWLLLPSSAYNYGAPYWVMLILDAVASSVISRTLYDNVIALERIVQVRTKELDAANREMRLVLDNVQQGFLTIDRSGVLAPAHSAIVDRWFGVPDKDASWFDYLHGASPAFASSSRMAWTQVVDDMLPLEVALDQMPRRLAMGGVQYRVEYRPVGDVQPCLEFLVIVTDITLEVEHEHVQHERSESMAIFERVLVDRAGLETFFDEAAHIVESILQGGRNDLSGFQRLVHTLKGNAMLYGLGSIAKQCELLEDRMAEEKAVPSAPDCVALADRWVRIASDVSRWLGTGTRTIEMSAAEHASLKQAIWEGEPREALARRVEQLKLEPTSRRLAHFADQAQRIAQRLEKTPITVRIEDHGVRLDSRRWAGFWGTFIHSVRNALDHGIETTAARAAAGKPPGGALTLRTLEQAGRIVVEIADDGQGINWAAVRERALREGLPCANQAELEKALFTNGISTSTEITDLSGRGIGLAALLESTRQMGGELSVDSTPGKGTRLRMSFPASKAADAEPLLQAG